MADCWICLVPLTEISPTPGPQTTIKCPGCSLIAHESCLLRWISQLDANDQKHAHCPQCKTLIQVEQRHFLLLNLRSRIEKASENMALAMVISGTSLAAGWAGYVCLYSLGAFSINCLCPKSLSMAALGVSQSGSTIRFDPLSRRQLYLIPSIPVWLIISGFRSRFVDVTSFAVPFLLDGSRMPWNLQGPQLTVALLPVARVLYQSTYDYLVDPWVQFWARQLQRPSTVRGNIHLQLNGNNFNLFDEEAPELEDEAPEVILEIAAEANDQNPPPALPNDNGEGENNNNQVNANQNENENNVLGPLQLLRRAIIRSPRGNRPRSEDWLISSRSLLLRVLHPLLWPVLSAMTGNLLSMVPWIRKHVPDRFTRNMIGGAVVVVLRDIVNVSSAYLRFLSQKERRIA